MAHCWREGWKEGKPKGAKFWMRTREVGMRGQVEMMEFLEPDWAEVVCGKGRGGRKKWAVKRIFGDRKEACSAAFQDIF